MKSSTPLNIPIKLGVDGEWLVTSICHLSRDKCRCLLERSLPLDADVEIMMLVPTADEGLKITQKIACAGVIKSVECVPDKKKELKYLVEIAFTAISAAEKRIIAEFENQGNV